MQIGSGSVTGEKIDVGQLTAGRLTLSAEAREKLVATGVVWDPSSDREPNEDQWRKVEDALLEILTPVRYVTGIPPKDADVVRGHREQVHRAVFHDTQANERGLTPLPLHEQRPGAWNFVEPRP